MLDGYRILDLADERALLTGLLFAQLGAEVVAVDLRTDTGDDEDADDRLDSFAGRSRAAYGRGRIRVNASPEEVITLAGTVDAVIDTGGAGVDLDRLRVAHPSLITLSISPFGTSGPKAHWSATDLTLAAASGHLALNGDADRAPVRISEPQAYHHAAIEAAVHLMAALMERRRSGLGQHIDVSAQLALTQATQMHMLAGAVGAPPALRFSGGARIGPYQLRYVYPAADGYVSILFLFGDMIGRFTQKLMAWVHEEGHCSEQLRDLDYIGFFELLFTGRLDPAVLTAATDAVAALTRTRTKAELWAEARSRRLLIAPVATTADTLAFEQFTARDYWEVETIELDGAPRTVRFAGPWAKASKTPLRRVGGPTRPGQHDERRAELLARPVRRVPAFSAAGPTDAPTTVDATITGRRALDGLRVLDFSWVLAGPMATRMLADHGATVVRIESDRRPDVIRASGPFLAGFDGPDDTTLWHSASAGKQSVQLDLSTEGGRAVARDLARWAELVFESYSPGAMAAMGLGYDRLAAEHPELVMVSSSLMGQGGPTADFAGFGNLAAAITGFVEITGWPDRPPAGPFTAYTDYVSPRFGALAALAAVEHARRTGVGQYLDLAQAEGALQLLAPALLDEQLHGRTATRQGNADRAIIPHGVYPCRGDDRWIAIACVDDAQWARLAGLIGLERLVGLDATQRRARELELDDAIARWSADQDAEAAQSTLQGLGVAAHQVQHTQEILADPQLRHLGFARKLPHPKHGSVWVEAAKAQLSRTQPEPRFAGPPLGHHTDWVLRELLAYDDDRIAELVIGGAIN